MTKWLMIVETNSNDTAREDEFNQWYDQIHLPDVGESPGVVRATRYENTDPIEGQAKFIALYEVETDDLEQTRKAMGENMAKKMAEGRFSELLEIVGQGTYKQISAWPEKP